MAGAFGLRPDFPPKDTNMSKTKPAEQPKDTVQTVKMKRSPDTNPPPYEADVHPAEVENMRSAGWTLAE